jgi:hypothetical protein
MSAHERIMPGAFQHFKLDNDTLVRDQSGRVIGRVVEARETEEGLLLGFKIDDPTLARHLLDGLAGFYTAHIPVEPVGEGLGWQNDTCSSAHQDCGGTFDPERGCHCV